MFWRQWSPTAKYEPLQKSPSHQNATSRKTVDVTFLSTGLLVLLILLISSISFIAGQHLPSKGPLDLLPLHIVPQVFQYNPIFAERPNVTTDKAWLDLFPAQGGFFKHPDLAPNRSTFAAFHQMHCLNGIRHAYWTLLEIALEGKKVTESELPHHASTEHLQHCIDILRQALMCQPDLTIEIQNDDLGGVTGFGTEHQCVDWGELIDWTSEWETYDQVEPMEQE